MRDDLFELVAHARERGLRCVLSTNGTLIDRETAKRIVAAGFSYVGISFDGIGGVHDKVRGKSGAYDASLRALRLLRDLGMRVGLRFTVHRRNVEQLPADIRSAGTRGYRPLLHLSPRLFGARRAHPVVGPGRRRRRARAVEYVFDRRRTSAGEASTRRYSPSTTLPTASCSCTASRSANPGERGRSGRCWRGTAATSQESPSHPSIRSVASTSTSSPGTTTSATSASGLSARSGPTIPTRDSPTCALTRDRSRAAAPAAAFLVSATATFAPAPRAISATSWRQIRPVI